MKFGDYTNLGKNYAESRPGYSSKILDLLIHEKNINFLDVGAGTGIWTKIVHDYGIKKIYAIEPNEDMRKNGIKYTQNTSIKWMKGYAEEIELKSNSFDYISMASSLHWTKLDLALKEFHRLLKKNGTFIALWNPRIIEKDSFQDNVEKYLKSLKTIKRKSSGLSGITNSLFETLNNSKYFQDCIYLESIHEIKMNKNRYLKVWKSVNDVRVSLGQEKFLKLLKYIDQNFPKGKLNCKYLTRVWIVKKK